jgi:putative colanic acid biosynthesis UDP-glucose lipid carrier transferase
VKTKTGRYSGYIRPFSYVIDLITIIYFSIYFLGWENFTFFYALSLGISWFIIAINIGFYEVYRYTKLMAILNCTFKQGLIFATVCFALCFLFSVDFSLQKIIICTLISMLTIVITKLSIFYFLKKYRIYFGGNCRKVILLGSTKNTQPLNNFFFENPDYGYLSIKTFGIEYNKQQQILNCFGFVLNNGIDEIYCAMADFTKTQIDEIIHFADNNLKTLKFIPAQNQATSQNYNYDYYDTIPVIPLREIALDTKFNNNLKRGFDILFSALIIVTLLSWLCPLLAIIIKLDSEGPLFFKQKRNGLNNKEFTCFKFRSMKLNDKAHLETVSKNDERITKVGKFIRKTSMDELPQFFNVLLGDMSVVGPRPHMVIVTQMYAVTINKFMVRHLIKPGITGLAQIKGFRGEVETNLDMKNRVKYDIFYLENWSILLDIKIVFNTIFNVVIGDQKAY